MKCKGTNHLFVVWAACFLWLTSMFAITWSLLLFLCFLISSIINCCAHSSGGSVLVKLKISFKSQVPAEVLSRNYNMGFFKRGVNRFLKVDNAHMIFLMLQASIGSGIGDILLFTGTDTVNALVLLSGIMMLPTNIYMLYSIANYRKIDPKAKVACCPLWLCIVWIIIINCIGAMLCLQRIYSCKETTNKNLYKSIKYYRSVPKYKHFIDNLQWSLKCCGLHSYRDWFNSDWYDKIRDYEWDPLKEKRAAKQKEITISDSVPLSCCKSGSCISNYLMELGTYSINTNGCGQLMHRIIMTSMNGHLIMFLLVVLVEISVLKFITSNEKEGNDDKEETESVNVCHLVTVNDNFNASSESYQINVNESDTEENEFNTKSVKEAFE